MHILSHHNRSEFLATPQLVRIEYAERHNGFEPTLLIKASTLLLKYVVLGAHMDLAIARVGHRILCALKVFDDGEKGGILWSIIEREEELNGLRGIGSGESVRIFLFNEIAVNVAWNVYPNNQHYSELMTWSTITEKGHVDHSAMKGAVDQILNQLHEGTQASDNIYVLRFHGRTDWKPVHNTFITSHATSSLIDLFDKNEGGQQEQIGIWLTDKLHPRAVHHSPQVPKGSGTRELTDILLSHQFGAIFIESKVLSVLTRDRLPDREKLKHDVNGHIYKAFNQLRGGLRKVRSGVVVTTLGGAQIDVDRTNTAHAIVMVPDLDLIENSGAYDGNFIKDFVNSSNAFPHLLDISELLRIVQAAEIISNGSTTNTLMMAFDYYLCERFKKAYAAGTLCIEVLLRSSDKKPEAT